LAKYISQFDIDWKLFAIGISAVFLLIVLCFSIRLWKEVGIEKQKHVVEKKVSMAKSRFLGFVVCHGVVVCILLLSIVFR
jgi:hypothetical protein